jgi:magnesium transporter
MNLFKLSLSKLNLPPGTPIYTGPASNVQTKILLNQYETDKCECHEITNINDIKIDKNKVNWIDVLGAVDSEVISKLGKAFNIHNMFIEDILNINQNPKVEINGDNIFVTIKFFDYVDNELIRQQVAIYYSKDLIITFQEGGLDIFSHLRKRNEGSGDKDKIYLLFTIFDVIVDKYHELMSKLYDQMESLEFSLFDNTNKKNKLEEIYDFRVDAIRVKNKIWHIITLFKKLISGKPELFTSELLLLYDDIEDKLKLYYEELKYYDEKSKSLIEIFAAISSEKMNQVMKILTIISSIFIPLSFITGLYGMNFAHMPGAENQFGFYIIGFMMLIIGLIMLIIFKIKKWID